MGAGERQPVPAGSLGVLDEKHSCLALSILIRWNMGIPGILSLLGLL